MRFGSLFAEVDFYFGVCLTDYPLTEFLTGPCDAVISRIVGIRRIRKIVTFIFAMIMNSNVRKVRSAYQKLG